MEIAKWYSEVNEHRNKYKLLPAKEYNVGDIVLFHNESLDMERLSLYRVIGKEQGKYTVETPGGATFAGRYSELFNLVVIKKKVKVV